MYFQWQNHSCILEWHGIVWIKSYIYFYFVYISSWNMFLFQQIHWIFKNNRKMVIWWVNWRNPYIYMRQQGYLKPPVKKIITTNVIQFHFLCIFCLSCHSTWIFSSILQCYILSSSFSFIALGLIVFFLSSSFLWHKI